MDKKQTLNPELKQIYERVMNTPMSNAPAPQTSAPHPSTQPVGQPPMPPLTANPAHVVTPPIHTVGSPSPVSSPPTPVPPAATHSVPTANPKITVHPPSGGGSAPAQTFVFSSSAGAHPVQQATAGTATAVAAKKGGLNAKIMVFAGITLFLFYIGFWLKFFHYF